MYVFVHVYFHLHVNACVLAGGPYRGHPQQQRPSLLQDLPGRLLLWGSPEASLWASRHQLWQQWSTWCWLPGSHGVHLRTGQWFAAFSAFMTFIVINNDPDSLTHVTQFANSVFPSCMHYYSIKPDFWEISLTVMKLHATAQVVRVSKVWSSCMVYIWTHVRGSSL